MPREKWKKDFRTKSLIGAQIELRLTQSKIKNNSIPSFFLSIATSF